MSAHSIKRAKFVKHVLSALDGLSISSYIDIVMEDTRHKKEVPMPTKPDSVATGTLGVYLASIRAAKGFTLREVEEATGKDVSNAYLSQLENGKITKPSPHVLHSLSEVYAVSYDKLMEKAGYIKPSSSRTKETRHGSAATFAIDNLTSAEEDELLRYLAYVRSKKGKA